MTDKDLKRLRRDELLEMLIAQSKRMEEMQAELDAARAALDRREILIQEAGSIAEAALRINGVFESAQAAAQQYLENIRRMAGSPPGNANPGDDTGETAEKPAGQIQEDANPGDDSEKAAGEPAGQIRDGDPEQGP